MKIHEGEELLEFAFLILNITKLLQFWKKKNNPQLSVSQIVEGN